MRLRVGLALLAAVLAIALSALPAAADIPGAQGCQLGPGPPAGSPGAGGVNIHLSWRDKIVWCPGSSISANADQPAMTYTLQNLNTAPYQITVNNAISITKLLTIAGVAASPTFTFIRHEHGGWAALAGNDLAKPSDFASGLIPTIHVHGDNTAFIRPLRNASDSNTADHLVAPSGTPLNLYVYRGSVLTVTVASSSTSPKPDTQVTFTASVSPANAGLHYIWDFGDGTVHPDGATITHRFAASRSPYYVNVLVKGTNDSVGISSVPAQENAAPQPNPGSPSKKKNTPSGTGSGSNNNPSGSGSGSNNNYNPTYTNPTTTTTPHKHTGPRIGNNTPGLRGGKIVEGRLISAVTPVSAAQIARTNIPPPAPVTQRSTQTSVLPSATVKPLAALLAALAIVLLLSSGAGQELRSLRRSIASARLG